MKTFKWIVKNWKFLAIIAKESYDLFDKLRSAIKKAKLDGKVSKKEKKEIASEIILRETKDIIDPIIDLL